MASASASFTFDNHPGVTYHARHDDNGFVQVSFEAGGEPVEICGFLVTQTPPGPPAPPEGE